MDDFDDDELWSHATKDVSPIKRDKGASKRAAQPKKAIDPTRIQTVQKPKVPARALEQAQDIDHRTAKRLRKGQIPLEGRIDLHGLSQVQAFPALRDFIVSCAASGKRCVLVITGKGPGADGRRDPLSSGQGVLKRRLPEWLDDPVLRPHVLKHVAAQPKHGGGGAFYVLLRRHRG